MFNSNVAPRVKKYPSELKDWLCKKCGETNAKYLAKCGGCSERRRG